jgi:hypothetical protein
LEQPSVLQWVLLSEQHLGWLSELHLVLLLELVKVL